MFLVSRVVSEWFSQWDLEVIIHSFTDYVYGWVVRYFDGKKHVERLDVAKGFEFGRVIEKILQHGKVIFRNVDSESGRCVEIYKFEFIYDCSGYECIYYGYLLTFIETLAPNVVREVFILKMNWDW